MNFTSSARKYRNLLPFFIAALLPLAGYAAIVPDTPLHLPYDEITDWLENDPSPVADIREIGQSNDGRTLKAIVVSDNPTVFEDEPVLLFTGIIHGKEVIGGRVCLDVIETLTEGYGNDPEITGWVDNYQIWFVPVLNPFGYEAPADVPGFRGLRKNGPDTDDPNTSGVDLARNMEFQWVPNLDNPRNTRFSGPFPVSEPETQAMIDLVMELRPIAGITFHAGQGNSKGAILYPWSNNGPGPGTDDLADPVDIQEGVRIARVIRDAVRASRQRIGGICNGSPFPIAGDPCDLTNWTGRQGMVGGGGYSSGFHAATGMFDILIETHSDITGDDEDESFREEYFYQENPKLSAAEQANWDLAVEYILNYHDGILGLLKHFETGTSSPHNKAGVTGRVTNLIGQPVSAVVRVVERDGTGPVPNGAAGILDRTSHPDTGRFTRLLMPGSYTIRISKEGYETQEHAITVTAPNLTALDVTLLTQLLPPTIISTDALDSRSVALQWTDSNPSGSLAYRVEFSTRPSGPWTSRTVSGTPLNPPPTSTTVDGLAPDTNYFFRVFAISLFNAPSAPSSLASEGTLRRLDFLAGTPNIVILEFDEVPNTNVYFFQRSQSGPNGTFSGGGSLTEDGFTRTFLASGLLPSRTYHFRMRPFLDSGSFGAFTEIVETHTAPLRPELTGSLLTLPSPPGALLNWRTGSDSDSTRIEWRPGNTGPFVHIGNSFTSTFTHVDLQPGDNQYLVRASFMNQLSAESNIVTVSFNASPEEQWRFDNFGTVQDSGDAADDADPDGDGSSNSEERQSCTDPNDTLDFPLPPLRGNLVAHWPLDDPLDPGLDTSGNAHHGVLSGSVIERPGASAATASSLEFDGSSVIDVPWCEQLNPGESFTVALWANPEVAGGGQFRSPFTNRDHDPATGSTHGMVLYNSNVGNWQFWTGDGNENWDSLAGPNVVTGAWTHLALVYDDALGRKTLYVNGVTAASDTAPDQYVANGPEMESLHIGSGGDAGDEFRFRGMIDDVALFASALSGPAINLIMEEGVRGFVDQPFEVTITEFDAVSQSLTLRWPNVQPPYVIVSSPDLDFGENSNIIPVDASHGTIDTSSFPGEIQFQFVDPAASGIQRYWQVRETK